MSEKNRYIAIVSLRHNDVPPIGEDFVSMLTVYASSFGKAEKIIKDDWESKNCSVDIKQIVMDMKGKAAKPLTTDEDQKQDKEFTESLKRLSRVWGGNGVNQPTATEVLNTIRKEIMEYDRFAVMRSRCRCCGNRTIGYMQTKCYKCGTENVPDKIDVPDKATDNPRLCIKFGTCDKSGGHLYPCVSPTMRTCYKNPDAAKKEVVLSELGLKITCKKYDECDKDYKSHTRCFTKHLMNCYQKP